MLFSERFLRFVAKALCLSLFPYYALIRAFLNDPSPATCTKVFLVTLMGSITLLAIDAIVIYPSYRSSLRHIPTISQPGLRQLTMVTETPRGATALQWMNNYPGADMLRVRGAFGVESVVLVSPAAMRDVLSANSEDFEKPWSIRAFLARSIGFGLILSEGQDHKRQRKALVPAFNVKKIHELYGLMWEKTGILLKQLEHGIREHPADLRYRTTVPGAGL